jgi:CDP-diacylglycerol--glycerol-3-phosphate 3-phosphatidyltransferase
MSFSDHLRQFFKYLLDYLGKLLNRVGFTPNSVTFIALFGNLIAAFLISFGQIKAGGVIALLMGPLDAVDGTMARLRNRVTPFGAFLDSISDRYSELLILGGLLFYFTQIQDWKACILAYLAAAGSVLVSYTRARGEALGFSVKSGLMTRVVRYLVMAPSLILNIPIIGLWIIAIFGNLTAIQRIWQVWRQSNQTGGAKYSLENLERK